MTAYREIEDLVDLPNNGRVCIYGAGGFGKQVEVFIEGYRPNLEVICYADTYQRGTFGTLPIINPEELARRDDLDYVFIASMYWQEITAALPEMGNVTVIKAVAGDIFLPDPVSKHPRKIPENHASELERTRALFSDETSRALFDKLIDFRCCYQEPLKIWVAENKPDVRRQYLDFLHYDQMKMAIEGGVFDGGTALAFLERMAPGARLIGFEPFREIYDQGRYKSVLEQRFPGAVYLEDSALWNETRELHFQPDTTNASASEGTSRVMDQLSPEEGSKIIKGILLDDYIAEKGIDRIDFLKLDIEGAEIQALEGARQTIIKSRPQMALCIYHKKEHLYQIPLMINDWVKGYRFHLGHYSDTFWETVFYAIPEEIVSP